MKTARTLTWFDYYYLAQTQRAKWPPSVLYSELFPHSLLYCSTFLCAFCSNPFFMVIEQTFRERPTGSSYLVHMVTKHMPPTFCSIILSNERHWGRGHVTHALYETTQCPDDEINGPGREWLRSLFMVSMPITPGKT